MIIVQLTGLSGAGKSTIADGCKQKLISLGLNCEVIDGDQYRNTISKGLGFSEADRKENIRRLGFMAHVLARNEVIAIIAAINPYEEVRTELKDKYPNVKTVWINCPINELQKRDTKGLYQRALLSPDHQNYLPNFTGISDPFDQPENPDLTIHTDQENHENSVDHLFYFILEELEKLEPPTTAPNALFVGRWQPFHDGHKWLIDQKLQQNIPVVVGVRNKPRDESNPFSTYETVMMIQKVYEDQPVKVMVIPDIESVNYGRAVGYEVNCFSPPEHIEHISGSGIRKSYFAGEEKWKNLINAKIHHLIEFFLNRKS
jgi:adenylylsulfate kinase